MHSERTSSSRARKENTTEEEEAERAQVERVEAEEARPEEQRWRTPIEDPAASPPPAAPGGSCSSSFQPVLVPPGHLFCHAGCSLRALALVVAYALLGVVGAALALTLMKPIGVTLLMVGPPVLILLTFYRRYSYSTTKRQTAITFCEAIFWMAPLLVLATVVDVLNADITMPVVEVDCSWRADAGGRDFVLFSSWTAQCSEWASDDGAAATAEAPLVERPAETCWTLATGAGGQRSRVTVQPTGSIAPLVIRTIMEKAVEGGLSCPALDGALEDVPDSGAVELLAVRRGAEEEVAVGSRSDLAGLFVGLCEEPLSSNQCQQWSASPDTQVTVTFQLRPKTVANVFVTAFFRAGFLEELLKYIAVRRILFKDRVADCGGLLVYGLAAGAGFATAENIEYVLSGGVGTAVARMVLSIPLHCTTGLLIGIFLGYRKFLGRPMTCLSTLFIPVLVHGSYDFVVMLPPSVGLQEHAKLGIAVVILAFAGIYCRFAWLKLEDVCVVDIHAMMREGRVSAPRALCCECDCCRPIVQHKDPLILAPPPSDAAADAADAAAAAASAASAASAAPSAAAPSAAAPSAAAPVAPSAGSARPVGQAEEAPADASPPAAASSTSLAAMGGLVRSASRQLGVVIGVAPKCQTLARPCLGCGVEVRASILYPSSCPHCGTRMSPDGRPQPDGRDEWPSV